MIKFMRDIILDWCIIHVFSVFFSSFVRDINFSNSIVLFLDLKWRHGEVGKSLGESESESKMRPTSDVTSSRDRRRQKRQERQTAKKIKRGKSLKNVRVKNEAWNL